MNTTTVVHDNIVSTAGGAVIITTHSALIDGAKIGTAVRSLSEDTSSTQEFVDWGETNDTPNLLKADLESSTVVTAGMRVASKLMYGGGLVYGTINLDGGKRNWSYAYDIEVERWLRKSNVARQLFALLYDLSFAANAFPLFTKSADGKSIARLSTKHTRAMFTRLGRVNGYGEHDKVYVNPDFGTNFYKEENTKVYKCAPEYGTADWVREKVKPGESFVLPIKAIDTGRQNYAQPDWNSARVSNWISIGKSVAALNKAMMNNSMRPLWHIEIHPDFWVVKFTKEVWSAYSPAQKLDKIKEFQTDLANTLLGVDNAGAYIASSFAHEAGLPEKAYSLLKITALENKLLQGKDGFYLTTSREVSQHAVVSMGLDSAMLGTMPGDGGMGAGSGSNNRVAFNQRVLLSKADQDMVLNFMYMVAEVNGWNEAYEWVIEQGLITTLDAGAEAEKAKPLGNENGGVNG